MSPGRNTTVLQETKGEMFLTFWKRGQDGGDRRRRNATGVSAREVLPKAAYCMIEPVLKTFPISSKVNVSMHSLTASVTDTGEREACSLAVTEAAQLGTGWR